MERRTATNQWPSVPASTSLSKMTIAAGTAFPPTLPFTRYDRVTGACTEQTESGDSAAAFLLEEGAILSRMTIGANQAEGVHCLRSCALDHVYFEVRHTPAKFKALERVEDVNDICDKYTGNDSGAQPPKTDWEWAGQHFLLVLLTQL
ncbi:hypothetical protein B0H17DRAFT_1210213 [Mycena rosella]|uniref:Pectate lyase n=1 Tax=Mycena rosella TaxID=1033263 RepID=A0AAD7G8R1_MYCRO|nr:hypothetical protein B0H17DRAFT_1210213 [Mycena rosella]